VDASRNRESLTMTTPLTDPTPDQLRPMATLQEYRFRSQVPLIGPLIARFRELWNGVSTRWYVRPIIQQQSEFNRQLVALLAAQAADLRDITLRLAKDEERLGDFEARLYHYDGWLIEQDREQSAAIGDLSDTAMRLVQTNRRLVELERRLAMLEANLTPSVTEQTP
jgi:hypothetical protein